MIFNFNLSKFSENLKSLFVEINNGRQIEAHLPFHADSITWKCI